MDPNTKNEQGNRYGRLKVLEYQEDERAGAYWKCKCDCGETTAVSGDGLRKGDTKSCGCYHKDLSAKRLSEQAGKKHPQYSHGDAGTRLYEIYHNIRRRCENPESISYQRYGGRGIECEWDDYLDFKDDMYEPYQGHVKEHGEKYTTIDRVDNDGNYCKENCRWATPAKQARSRSDNVRVEYNGEEMCVSEWARKLEINKHTIYSRLNQGWSPERALTEPVNN